MAVWTTYLIPVYILGLLLLVFATFFALSRIRGGRYLRPIVQGLSKIPFMRRWFEKASRAAIERQNPELASAIRKLERSGALRDPQRAQRAMSSLTPAERQAYLEAAAEQGAIPAGSNRAERRRLERMRETNKRKR